MTFFPNFMMGVSLAYYDYFFAAGAQGANKVLWSKISLIDQKLTNIFDEQMFFVHIRSILTA